MKNTSPSAQTEWITEFRKRFIRGHGPISCGDNYPQEAESWVEADQEDLEDFIYSLLASERTRLLSVESMKMEEIPSNVEHPNYQDYVDEVEERNALRQSILSEMEKGSV